MSEQLLVTTKLRSWLTMKVDLFHVSIVISSIIQSRQKAEENQMKIVPKEEKVAIDCMSL